MLYTPLQCNKNALEYSANERYQDQVVMVRSTKMSKP